MQQIQSAVGSVWNAYRNLWSKNKIVGVGATLVIVCVACSLCTWVYGLTPGAQQSAAATRVAREQQATAQFSETDNARVAAEATGTFVASLPTATTAPTETLRPSATPRPSETLPPIPTAQPTATPFAGLIPDLYRTDVTVNLEQRGFQCLSVQELQSYFVWSCKQTEGFDDVQVDVWGKTLLTVDLVEVNYLQSVNPSDEGPRAVMGFVATLPYRGAEPEKARAWIEAEFPKLKGQGDVHETTFGGVKYRLYGIPTARILEIGDLRE